jgi:hypothetical protein
MQHASWLLIAVIGVRQTSEKLGGISFKLETKIMNLFQIGLLFSLPVHTHVLTCETGY